MGASEKAKKESGLRKKIFASKPKIRKVKSNEDDSDFECYNKSERKLVHVDIDKEITQGGPALALQRNKLEEEETRRPASTSIFFAQLQIFWSIFAKG